MQKLVFTALIMLTVFISCNKSDPVVPGSVNYMSLAPGSTWNYELVNKTLATTNLYTVISTNKDSVINGKSYHVFTNSSSGSEYYNITGNDYYSFRSLPLSLGGSSIENIYLKDNAAVGNSWSQSYAITLYGFPMNITVTNTVIEKGINKTVNGNLYDDVIHISSGLAVTVSGFQLPASALQADIQSYYAKKVGLIQGTNILNINYSGIKDSTNQVTMLKSSDIK